MQIEAQVDESDIGQIKEGQKTRFTVQAYPEKKVTGTVRQIRLQPETVQNVVNYTVVVDAKNDDGLLLPGMTATVDFIVEDKKDILLVPNSVLAMLLSASKVGPQVKAASPARAITCSLEPRRSRAVAIPSAADKAVPAWPAP